jgi:hypothetical protein
LWPDLAGGAWTLSDAALPIPINDNVKQANKMQFVSCPLCTSRGRWIIIANQAEHEIFSDEITIVQKPSTL